MKFFIAVMAVILLTAGVFGVWFAPDKYSGKEVFYTEQAYQDFKLAVADSEVAIKEIEVLSSEPPVVVDFRVRVPNDYPFDYGSKENAPFILGVFCVCAGIGLSVFTWELAREDKSSR